MLGTKILPKSLFLSLLFSFFICLFQPVSARAQLPQESKEYIMLSLPKSGTYLLYKLLKSLSSHPLTYIGEFPELAADAAYFPSHHFAAPDTLLRLIPPSQKTCLFGHFNFSEELKLFCSQRPQYVKLAMVRDLRDVCVSTTYFIDSFLVEILGPQASFDEKLLYVIEGTGHLFDQSVYNMRQEAEVALQWIKDPSVVVCRFEDLCGTKGGGHKKKQEKQILKIANALNVSLKQEELKQITDNLWGESNTFRKGQIGGWETHFKPMHVQAFKKSLGDLLIALGYAKDFKWEAKSD